MTIRKLTRAGTTGVYHIVDRKRVAGPHAGLRGDVTDLRGDVTDLRGYVSDLRGDVTDLRGDVTGLFGNVTGLRGDVTDLCGDVDRCEITDAERMTGVSVEDLVDDG